MRFKRIISLASLAAMPLLGTALVGTAQAAPETLSCGQNVDHSVTLANDVGPCAGDGLVVTTSGITINLNGHSITGSNTTNNTAQEQVGIRLIGVSNVTVSGPGTIKNFDAGVAIEEGSRNTVQRITARDNINHSALTGANNPCEFGDGVVAFDSSRNVVQANRLENNGPYDGAAFVGNSDANLVRANQSINNLSLNRLPDGSSGPCGPFGGGGSATPGPGRPDQNIGIRIEGPGADNNQVLANQVHNNLLDGITVNGHVCGPPPGFPGGPQPANTGNAIRANNVTGNGFGPITLQDGIAILRQGPFGTITCPAQRTTIEANTTTGNARHGIFVPALSNNNTVRANQVSNNGTDGLLLEGPFTVCPPGQGLPGGGCRVPRQPRAGAEDNTLNSNRGTGNGQFDGADLNLEPPCDNNLWRANRFGTVNQPCVAANGGTGTVPPSSGAGVRAFGAPDQPAEERPLGNHPAR